MAQKPPTRSDWERLIVKIAGAFDEASIPYHLDASTALYVQGIDFEMDDLDITVKWGCLLRSKAFHQAGALSDFINPLTFFSLRRRRLESRRAGL